jgi:hypothetical protein
MDNKIGRFKGAQLRVRARQCATRTIRTEKSLGWPSFFQVSTGERFSPCRRRRISSMAPPFRPHRLRDRLAPLSCHRKASLSSAVLFTVTAFPSSEGTNRVVQNWTCAIARIVTDENRSRNFPNFFLIVRAACFTLDYPTPVLGPEGGVPNDVPKLPNEGHMR